MPTRNASRSLRQETVPVDSAEHESNLDRQREIEKLGSSLGASGRAHAEILYDLEQSSREGDLRRVHELYSAWFSEQEPDLDTGVIVKRCCWHAIRACVENDQPTCLAYLLGNGIKASMYDKKAAVEAGSIRILQVLLNYDWDVNEPEAWCEPPLLARVVRAKPDHELINWFLDHGANPDASAAFWDITPLSYAVARSSLSIVKLMFERGGSTARGALLCCAADREDYCVPILEFLVDQGAVIDEIRWEHQPQLFHMAHFMDVGTPLLTAVRAGNADSVRCLLKRGADRSKRSVRTQSLPLEIAKKTDHTEIINLLNTYSRLKATEPFS